MSDDTDNNNPLSPLADNLLDDAITLSADPKKVVAKKTLNAYQQSILTPLVALPLVSIGPPGAAA